MAESTVNKKSISALDPISDNNVSLLAKSAVQQPNQIPFEQVSLNQIKRTIIAECSTAAATANKTATVTNFAGFALIPGMEILVHFTNANTASNITLSINDTNAYPIKVLGTTEQLGNGSIKAGTYKKLIFTGDTYLTEAPTISAVYSGSDLPLNSSAVSGALAELSATKIVNTTDANDCLPSANKTEIFFVNSLGSNLPEANNYVIVANRTGTDTETRRYSQMAYRVADDSLTNDIYTRIAIKGTSDANITFSNWKKIVTSSKIPTNRSEATLLLRKEDNKVFGEFAITPTSTISIWFTFCQITKPKDGANIIFTLTENEISPAPPLRMFILGSSGFVQNELQLTAGKRYYGTFYYDV